MMKFAKSYWRSEIRTLQLVQHRIDVLASIIVG